MDQKMQTDGFEIDIVHLLSVLWKNILVIILVAVICGTALFGYTYMYVAPTYQATVSMYVNSSTFSLGSSSISISNSELTASSNLVSTYIAILKSRTTMEMVAEEANVSYDANTLLNMVSAKQIEGTAAFKITVSCSNPQEAELIANTLADVLPKRIGEIVDGSSVRIIDYAIIPSYRSAPSYTKATIIGAAIGAVLSCALVVGLDLIKSYTTKDIASSDDVKKMFPEYTVLAVIPDMRYVGKKGYGYGSYYGSYGSYSSYGNKNGGNKNGK